MVLNQDFAEALVAIMIENGWQTALPQAPLPNPLDIRFHRGGETQRLLLYARPITAQASVTSSHNRPTGEMHTQMIFDGDKRGAGLRNHLRFAGDAKTVLVGFYLLNGEYIIAAYDPQFHREYAYSKSLQMKYHTLEKAAETGIGFQARNSGETIVAFPIVGFPEYLDNAEDFHSLRNQVVEAEDTLPEVLQSVFDDEVTLPTLKIEDRQQTIAQVSRYIRNRNFAEGIKQLYERCAICDFQYDYILDAAHIVPVADGGTDTYDNGLGLCPNCHRMFDKGLILVDEDGNIYLNHHRLEEYEQLGRAASFDRLQAILRATLWLPSNANHQPGAENLHRTFIARNKPEIDF